MNAKLANTNTKFIRSCKELTLLLFLENFRVTRTCFTQAQFYYILKMQLNKSKGDFLLRKKIKRILDITSYSCSIILSLINPITGLMGNHLIGIVAEDRYQVKTRIADKIAKKWNALPVNTKRAVILGALLSSSVGIILIASMFSEPTGRGGITYHAWNKFRSKSNIRPNSVSANFCTHLYYYARSRKFSSDFIPPSPYDLDYAMINRAILKISEMIANKQNLEMSETVMWVLLNMCAKTTFRSDPS